MNNVTYQERGHITDVLVNGRYVGAAIFVPETNKYCTVHANNAESKNFEAYERHFALYYVEKQSLKK